MTQDLTARPAAPAAGRPWPMLLVLLLGQFMGLLDVYVVNVAMPTIGADLHASGAALQLVVGGYTAAYAMLLITGARLGDLYGRRRMYLAGAYAFTLSSLACGLAPGSGLLVGFRVLQGAAAAVMVPQIISVIQMQFTGRTRAKALSAYAAVLSIGSLAGLVLGGVLVSADLLGLGWRPIFLINIPLGIALATLVPRLVPADPPTGAHRLDLAGLSIAVPAATLIVLPLVLGHELGWPAWTFACVAAGIALAAVFVLVERRVADPLLNLTVLRAPGMPAGLLTMLCVTIAYGGFVFIYALHMQSALGYGPLRAAATYIPFGGAFGLVAFYWRALPGRIHPALPPLGLALCALAMLGFATHDAPQVTALSWAALVAFGAGIGGAISLMAHSLVHVPRSLAADASGLLTTTMQLGQVIGVAAAGTIYLSAAGPPAPDPSAHAVSVTAGWLVVVCLAGAAIGTSVTRTLRAGAVSVSLGRRPWRGRVRRSGPR